MRRVILRTLTLLARRLGRCPSLPLLPVGVKLQLRKMDSHAKVSLAVIASAVTLIVLMVLAFCVHQSLNCPSTVMQGVGSDDAVDPQQAKEELAKLRHQLQASAWDLAVARNETLNLKGNLTEQLQEVSILTQQVFKLSSENHRLQDDLLTWKEKSQSTAEELQKARSTQEGLELQIKYAQEQIMHLQLHSKGGGPTAAGFSGGVMAMALSLLLLGL
ncbi:uncharacterized protein [Ambystoma mexicanum]|uniref:uncharacterized protein n=1 Tax=Ambystoma mexicanum TaxID=8296 RepID=UPI0037E8D76D